ncbi:STAS domain-containing protein [Thermosipho globiformans]|uniref:STAS domain-containing protein n=1 Tax=Thermosipho globiformans TaxID=380685 RepID=UPI000F8CE8F1|nr:STAS domain-containing protein [Thermosipho globiformans]
MYEVTKLENIPVIKITGEIDISNAYEMKQFIHENILNNGEKYCILDLSHLKYIDSSGLGILVGLHKSFKLQGGEIVLVNMNENIKNLLKLTSLDRVLNIKDTPKDAIDFLKN